MYSLGIDIGYSSVKISLVTDGSQQVFSRYVLHRGKITQKIAEIISELSQRYALEKIKYGAVTGSGSRFLHQSNKIKYLNEVAAVVEGAHYSHNDAKSIIEMGGEGTKYITDFNPVPASGIQISMNPSCSAGTGSFLEEQLSRLNLNLEDYSRLSMNAQSIPRIAGRCSVFAKTDIIHHQQEGVTIPDMLMGLAHSVVRNYRCAVMKRHPVRPPVLFVGGVAHNQAIIAAIKETLQLNENELIIPTGFDTIGALGAALMAYKEKHLIDVNELLKLLEHKPQISEENQVIFPSLSGYGNNETKEKHNCSRLEDKQTVSCYLGVDVGSTTTKLVLIDDEQNILSYNYLRTLGKPLEAVQKGLDVIKEQFSGRVKIAGAGTTGSGRYLVADYIGADVLKDEITAQAAGVTAFDSNVDTIFEIGGQDSKYIRLNDGVVVDFMMNKICAAGTGSFIEEQAKKLNIPLDEFNNLALCSTKPVDLGERCTVFIESSVASKLSTGEPIEDIAAGLCYAIVKNYLNRVVGNKKIGNKVFLQGGIAFNQGVINAFKALVGDRLVVPPFFSVTGAFGAAILAKDEISDETVFKGFNPISGHKPRIRTKESVSQYDVSINEMIFSDYTGKLDTTKKTVGIPRAIFCFGLYPLFSAFFKALGFNVLLSDPTNECTIKYAQEYITDEACFPVKLVNGHVAELVEKGVDYIFIPDIYTVEHSGSSTRQNYGCPYMQLASKIIKSTVDLEKKGIKLLALTLAYNQGLDFKSSSFVALGAQLGKTPEDSLAALKTAEDGLSAFRARMGAHATENYANISKDKDVFVLISQIYGLVDPVLNMGIPRKLEAMGYPVIPFFDLPQAKTDCYPNLYWPFGVHVLEAAKFVKQHHNMHAIFLTHHGCGPDAILSHYFQEIMNGKPYLSIEVDEHASKVGVITRVEAFVNSIKNKGSFTQHDSSEVTPRFVTCLDELNKGTTLYLPYLYPYSQILQKVLEQQGLKTKLLPNPSPDVIEEGRKHVLTNEYYSLTSILGMALTQLKNETPEDITLYIPQNEGAEIDGQLPRFLWTKMQQNEGHTVNMFSPYVEDIIYGNEQQFSLVYHSLIMGDIVYATPFEFREQCLEKGLELIEQDKIGQETLNELATWVRESSNINSITKRILAVGEKEILYNSYLNNYIFSDIEEKGNRVLFSPLSETMWMYWHDHVTYNKKASDPELKKRLEDYKQSMCETSILLGHLTPFEENLEMLFEAADSAVGYYTGANGRYRVAKLVCQKNRVNGAIAVSSLYENTGIALNTIHRSIEKLGSPPLMNLTFDGTNNEKDLIKAESFIHYL